MIAERPVLKIATHPGTVAVILGVLTLAAVIFIQNHDSSVCTAQILEEKRAFQQKLMEEQSLNTQKQAVPAPTMPNLGPVGGDEGGTSVPSPFGSNIFSPENLGTSAPESQ